MLSSVTTFAILSFLGLSSAIPTPSNLAARTCGKQAFPTFIQQIEEINPTTVGPNTLTTNGLFVASQAFNSAGQVDDRVSTVIGFENIPAGSYGCQLSVTFPANYPITSSGQPTLNVTTLYKSDPAAITYPNNFSWDTVTEGEDQGLFGTVTLAAGTTYQINSESCSDNLAFVFSIASWESQQASVTFDEYINQQNGAGLAGAYLTYDC